LSAVAANAGARALVLTGAGRGFCSGADLHESVAEGGAGSIATPLLYARQRRWSQLSLRLHELPVPVIAAINGPAAGGGFALALACDLRVAADTASFVAANVRIGLTGGEMGLTWLLTCAVGTALATELLLTARSCDAAEALSRGIVSRVVPGSDLLPAALDYARLIKANPAFGIMLTKEMLRVTPNEASLRQALVLEDRSQSLSVYSGDVDRASVQFERDRGRG
jgi:enoyl-CoA hydratase